MAKKLRSEQVDLSQYYNKSEAIPLIQGSNITLNETEEGLVISSSGDGGGSSVHNDLTGRSAADAHPISAITGLQTITDKVVNANNLVAGSNITLTSNGNDIVISATGEGGGEGTSVHNELTGRDTANAHPVSAITGLSSQLSTIEEDIGTLETAVGTPVDLTTLPGYNGSVKQYLTHDASGVVRWENS